MINSKTANTQHSIISVIANRWSPLAYSDKSVEKDKVESLLEAARWAPSSFNEQPWSYIVGFKGDEVHDKLGECLMDGNSWAKKAGVLMLSVAKLFFEHGHKLNRHSMHDLGMATMNLVLQATEMDLITHQMAGFDLDKSRKLFEIGEDYEPGSMIAIGYAGDVNELSEDMKQMQEGDRVRKESEEMVWTL